MTAMNAHHQHHCRLVLLLSLFFLPFNLFAIASESQDCTKPSNTHSFRVGWPLLQTAVDKVINQVEGFDNSSFTSEQYMFYYTVVYELCTDRRGDENSKLLYGQFKKVFDEYINSTVLPSLRVKKDETLLIELLRRWSNHKIMTRWLSRFFNYLNRYYISRRGLPSLEESSLLSFYDLVYGEMNKQIMDAVLSMIDREHAGEHIDRALLNNVLAVYLEIGDGSRKYHAKGFEEMLKGNAAFYFDGASGWIASYSFKDYKSKEEKLIDNPINSTKKVSLRSSNGDFFKVDYAVAHMAQTIKHMIETNSTANSIPLKVSSKILAKVLEYCYKHVESSESKDKASDNDLKDWDAKFLEVDRATLFDLVLASNYLNIKSLQDLTTQKVADMMIGKNPDEIRKIFNIKDDFSPGEEDKVPDENPWAFE